MAETQAPAAARQLPQVMPAGGQVVAVVPQSIEEIFRVSKGVVQSGLAPYALTGKTETEADINRATSAVAIVIMAGAELGLPPMVALRSFTAINGRPALYGDGLINVVRRSKMAKRINVGFTPTEGDDPYGDKAAGWCEAERADTGESKRIEFSVRQAKRAGLWQPDDKIWKDVWSGPKGNRTSKREQVPNDSPWYRYPERMLGWRAAGFCLRELFGDVLGGITDDWEAREIAGMVDVTPQQQDTRPAREIPEVPGNEPQPPPPTDAKATSGEVSGDSDPAGGDFNDDDSGVTQQPITAEDIKRGERAMQQRSDEVGAAIGDEALAPIIAAVASLVTDQQPAEVTFVPKGEITPEVQAQLEQLEGELILAADEPTLEEAFDEADVQTLFAGNDLAIARAFQIKADAINTLATRTRKALEASGQGTMFDIPEVP